MELIFVFGIIVVIIIVLCVFFTFVPVGLWISAMASGVHVSIMTLIGMRIRRIVPSRLIFPMIKATKAGIDVTINKLEAHYLAGGNVDRVINALIAAKKAGIKPIIGCEVYVASRTRHDKDARKDDAAYHLVLLAENDLGYHNLMKIVSKGFVEGFYYRPRVDMEVLEQFLRHAAETDFTVLGLTYSPIRGPEGNIEYLGYLAKGAGDQAAFDLKALVEESHTVLKEGAH